MRRRCARSIRGDPSIPGVVIGLLITDAALKGVDERVQEAVTVGANIIVGGKAVGRVYEPTILTIVSPQAAVSRVETFGPVLDIRSLCATNDIVATCYILRYRNNIAYRKR